jgi:hypothetical protein
MDRRAVTIRLLWSVAIIPSAVECKIAVRRCSFSTLSS